MTDGSPTPESRSWLGRAPIAPAIVAVGVLISLGAWFGMRSVENSRAEVDFERQLLAEGSELQSVIQRQVRGIDGLGLQIAETGLPSDSQLNRYFETVGLASNQAVVVERIGSQQDAEDLLEREGVTSVFADSYSPPADSHYVVTRSRGFDASMLGSSFDGSPDFQDLVRESRLLEETVSISNGDLPDAIAQVDGSTLLILSSVAWPEAEELDGADAVDTGPQANDTVVIGFLELEPTIADLSIVDPSEQVAFSVHINGEQVGSTVPDGLLERPVGDPIQFTEENTLWEIQGYSNDVAASRGLSIGVLVAGLSLTGLAALFARTVRRHSKTLGRLERSEHDAKHDALTGLLNRSGLTDELTSLIGDRRGSDLIGVLFLDLDRLKVVNDSIGHAAGDEVLVEVSKRLEKIIREDDIIGRFGGDEFVIVSQGVPAIGDLTTLAERVLDSLKEPAVLSDESSQVISTSIGIAYVAKGDASAGDLLRDADLAMYRAKEAGGARYEVFDDEMRAQAVARLEVERELRRAIRTGQLVVHYQPIVDIRTGGVDRLEALVRWQHPVRGMVPPGAFLSVAAESGLIVDLGEHVLRESCRQAAIWSSAVGRDIMVSVNVAERQLIDSGLIDTVRRVLAETGIKPTQLELEITEELIVDRLDHRLTVLHELVAMGVQLAIDDFGTSRASLGQLKKLDMVDTLKIDRAFVIDVANDVVDRKIITAIVALADSVGMEVVAEGVEEEDQVAILRQLGIDHIQGFYFQRPGPSEQMVKLLTTNFDVPEAANAPV